MISNLCHTHGISCKGRHGANKLPLSSIDDVTGKEVVVKYRDFPEKAIVHYDRTTDPVQVACNHQWFEVRKISKDVFVEDQVNFKTEKDAQACLDACRNEWEILFGMNKE